ncbi:MAG: LysE family translocator [Acidimicrobiia bacterium]|nr:LysE family translocator [Acidimicrobiia bacterium]
MPPPSSLATFAVTAFLIIVVPGPSVMFVVSRGVALGRRAALATVAGNAVGVYVQVLAVAVGLGAVVERSAVLFDAIKIAGALYLMFLGVQAIRHRRALSDSLHDPTAAKPSRHLFRDGFVVGVANPKAIVFFAAILPQFVAADGARAGVQIAVLGLIFVAIALVSDSVWGLLAGTARNWLARSPRRLRGLGTTSGLVMLGLGVRLALTGPTE